MVTQFHFIKLANRKLRHIFRWKIFQKQSKNKTILYHSPDFLFSLTSTNDLVLLTLSERRLIDLIRASGMREKRGESTRFSGIKKFLTANIVTVLSQLEHGPHTQYMQFPHPLVTFSKVIKNKFADNTRKQKSKCRTCGNYTECLKSTTQGHANL